MMSKYRWLGSGVLLAQSLIATAQEVPMPAAPTEARTGPAVKYDIRNGYNLAFVDADVRRVADAVLGAMLGVNYTVDPSVTGNITLKTARPVARESLVSLLEDALRSVDAAIVVSSGTYRVVPRAAARSSGAMAGATGSLSGFATEVITVKNASAMEMAKLVEQFLGKETIAGVNAPRNQLLISGSESERAAARTMIARFDVDALSQMTFETYRLDSVEADTVVKELGAIFKPPLDIIGSRVRLVPLPRLRSIIAIAADPADLRKIEPWIRRLDAGAGGRPRLYSYAVQNGRARDLARTLQRLLGSGSGSNDFADPSPSASAAPMDSALGTGFGSSRLGQNASVAPTPQATEPAADADYSSASGRNGPKIVPNEETNSLLIYATGEQFELVRDALTSVDRPVAQVLIEATLAEVTLTKDLDLGVDWSFVDGKSTFDLRNAATAVPAAVFPGFSYAFTNSSAKVVLNTLQSKTNVKVLSAPRLIVLNNQTATLQVGDQVPIVTQQAQSVSSAGAPIVNSIELRDTGVILRVTPRVNESGLVTLDIAQEVSDVARTTTSGINSPTIQQRRLSSTVTTRSGQMIALGGLIRESATRTKSGVPLLSQIPLLGAAFGDHSRGGSRTELIVLLTPIVMRSPEDVRSTVGEIINKLDETKPLIEKAQQRQVGSGSSPPR